MKNHGLDSHWKLVRKRSGFALKSGPELVLFWRILVLLKMWLHCVATIVVTSQPPNGDRLHRRPLVPISNKKELAC